MNKFLQLTDSEISGLKGATLKDMAAILDIKGRSTMKADELRAAVRVAIEDIRNEFVAPQVEAPSYENTGWSEPDASAETETFIGGEVQENSEPDLHPALANLSADDLTFVFNYLEHVTGGLRDATDDEVAAAVAELDRPRLVPNRAERRRQAKMNRKNAARRVGR